MVKLPGDLNEFPTDILREAAEGLRDGTIRLEATQVVKDAEVEAWLRACAVSIAEELERQTGSGHA